MVFPVIPAETKQELPNQQLVQFVHPSNHGEFSFTVQKSPAGFNVTIKPMLGGQAATQAVPEPAGASEVPEVLEPPMIEIPAQADAFPPIDLQPIDNSGMPLQSEPASEQWSHGPDPVVADSPRGESQTFASVGEISFEDLKAEPAYIPPVEEPGSNYDPEPTAAPEPVFSADPCVSTEVADRRVGERRSQNQPARDRMEGLFHAMAEAGASDLHLSVGMPPIVRKDGRMQKLESAEGVLDEDSMKDLLHSIMPERNKEEFEVRRDSDFAYEIPGLARFRSNIFMDRKGMGAVFRIIPSKMTTAEQLGLSDAIMGLCDLSKGLVVVTGPTGSGKSTTLCAMVNHINMSREDHIITIEDPVEFVHENIKCLVNQREVHNHTMSFKDALRAALREDPDIILVGEMRDLETISIAIETAETGHLVFGTLHTTTAVSTVDRIIDQFPADRQQQVRVMLSESLKGVVAQTLLPKKGGGRVAALEVLIVTPAISNLIREGKTFQIASAMQTGRGHGMVMLNDALYDLVQKDLVEPRDAYLKAVDKTGFEAMLTKGGYKI
ncbi:MAG: PilT/PilU family type 4a pilus ATPase [Chloracidobacterium sp.]|nr:PilT/PilU family type 4a pilus ATPase [Chloracidobacterium sp.]